MLPKKERVSKENFGKLGSGTLLHNPLFSLKIVQIKDSSTKASFVVSHKVTPKAVRRNSLRRLGYQTIQGLIPLLKPAMFIFYLKKEVVLAKPKDFRAQIERVLEKYLV